jgi:hypothetical protein
MRHRLDDLPKCIQPRQHLPSCSQRFAWQQRVAKLLFFVLCSLWLVDSILIHEKNSPACSPASPPTLPEELLGCSIEPTGVDITMKKNVPRALIEVCFIIFLFYSNLLMGEFERSGMGLTRGVAWAIRDILTAANFAIALIAALIGYALFEFLRKRF